MSLRELPGAVCGHLLRTVRADGVVPLCQSTGIGKQHLSADGCDYVDWSACQDSHSDYGVCHRAAPQGNGHCGIGLLGRPGPPASYPDDGADDDIRYASVDVLERCGCQRQLFAGYGCSRRYACRNIGIAFRRSGVLHHFEYLQEKIRPPMEEEADVQVLLEKQKSEAERAKN